MFSTDFKVNQELMDKHLRVGHSFDILTRALKMNGKQARLYFVDGMIEDNILNKILETLLKVEADTFGQIKCTRDFVDNVVPYGEVDITNDAEDFVVFVLAGCVGLLLEGFDEAILIDVRSYPARPVMEPENDRVLRGPREGFVEVLVHNTALVRRHIRDPRLTMEAIQVGRRSRSDVVLCYLDGQADPKIVERLRNNLRNISINTLTMGMESLTECMSRRQWWNPFPRARYTERPDTAAASVAEGQIVLLMDNSPAAMILPTGIFDFFQDTNDFCFLPVTGMYLRWLRIFVTVLTTFLTPAWLYIVNNPSAVPDFLYFVKVEEPPSIPVLIQLLLIELVLGALRLASLNTPSALIGSFAVVGALVLGEVAVLSDLLVPQTVLMMGFVALANFAQPSYELGYALTFMRILTLLLVALFHFWGLVAGLAMLLLLISITRTISGTCYWYPLVPFNGRALKRLLFRVPIKRDNS